MGKMRRKWKNASNRWKSTGKKLNAKSGKRNAGKRKNNGGKRKRNGYKTNLTKDLTKNSEKSSLKLLFMSLKFSKKTTMFHLNHLLLSRISKRINTNAKLSTKDLSVMAVELVQSWVFAINAQSAKTLIFVPNVKKRSLTLTHSLSSKPQSKDHTLFSWWSTKKVNSHSNLDKKDKTHSLRIFLLKLRNCFLLLHKEDNIKERTGAKNSRKVTRISNKPAQWNSWRCSSKDKILIKSAKKNKWIKMSRNQKRKKKNQRKTIVKNLLRLLTSLWACSWFQKIWKLASANG